VSKLPPDSKNVDIPKDSKEATRRWLLSEDTKRFQAHLLETDLLGVVVRGHLFIEAKLTGLIEFALKKPEALKLRKKSFALKVELAIATGVIEETYRNPLTLLGRLRNKFSHDVDYKLTTAECEAFFKALPALPTTRQAQLEAGSGEEGGALRAAITVLYAVLSALLDARRDSALLKEVRPK
jgi:hypothetical protein